MLALDQKIDDGVANRGNVMSSSSTAGFGTDAPSTTCSNGANYIVTNPGFTCLPIVRVGTINGNLL